MTQKRGRHHLRKWSIAVNLTPVVEYLQTLLPSSLNPEFFIIALEHDVIGSFIFHLFRVIFLWWRQSYSGKKSKIGLHLDYRIRRFFLVFKLRRLIAWFFKMFKLNVMLVCSTQAPSQGKLTHTFSLLSFSAPLHFSFDEWKTKYFYRFIQMTSLLKF